MVDLLALTLTQREPEQDTGESAGFHWQWLGEGVLQCTPVSGYEKPFCFLPEFMAMKRPQLN